MLDDFASFVHRLTTGTRQQDTGRQVANNRYEMKKTETQQKQRRRQNAKAALKRRENIAEGFCGCGREREDARWKLCARCREQARNRYYGIANTASPRRPKRVKEEPVPANLTGVRRVVEADGLGNVNAWWVANCYMDRKQVSRRWSIRKHGELGAFRQARAQRLRWEKSKVS